MTRPEEWLSRNAWASESVLLRLKLDRLSGWVSMDQPFGVVYLNLLTVAKITRY